MADPKRKFQIESRLLMRKLSAAILIVAIVLCGWTSSGRCAQNAANSSASTFIVCSDQTYALCATASCFVFDQVAYCECDIENGDSISLADSFDNGNKNVCTVNAEGASNGYMVSAYSLPDSLVAPSGNMALYNCKAGSNGAYAQCDGGVCFTSSSGNSFPGFDAPLTDSQIICSCPITVANPDANLGFQIAGPYPCQKSFFKNCKLAATNKKNGSTIYVGAPTGTAVLLTKSLNGSVPALNKCPYPQD